MSTTLRWSLITAIAPVLLGSAYLLTRTFLPVDYPLYGSAIRALPAGLLLLLIARKLPRGQWWWKSLVLGSLNFGSYFLCAYIAAQLLPTGLAATLMAPTTIAMMLFAWPIIGERPRILGMAGGILGVAGIFIMLFTGNILLNPLGLCASLGAILSSTFGALLTKRWRPTVNVIAATSWQLIAGGLVMSVIAVVVEGPPPALDVQAWIAFAFLSLVATAIGFCIWFAGLAHLSVGTAGLLGLLAPVTGVVLGVFVAGEAFSLNQLLGMALVFVGIIIGQPIVVELLRGRKTRAQPLPLPPEVQPNTAPQANESPYLTRR